MAINLDSAQAAAGPMRLERREADARQDRWMLELEKAMFSTLSSKAAKDQPAVDAAETAAAPLERAALPIPVTPGAPLQPAAAGDTAQAAVNRAAPQQAHSGAHDGGNLSGQAPTLAPAPDAPASTEMLPAFELSAHSLASASVWQAAQGSGVNLRGATPASGAELPLAAVQAVFKPSGAIFQAGMPAPAPPSSAPPDSAIDAEHGAARAARTAEQEPYAKRALHVQVGADGVHAWIRDAALQQGQLSSVMQALAAEVALGGKPLAGLTVNGKPLELRAPVRVGEEGDSFGAAEQDGAAPSLSPYSNLFQKGNPAP